MKKIILLIIVIAFISFIYSQYKKSLQEPNKIIPADSHTGNMFEEKLEEDFDYILALQDSMITWTGSSILKSHTGTLNFTSGGVNMEKDLLSGKVIVDMASIVGDAGEALNGHLKSADFFHAAVFPTASLSFTEVSSDVFEGMLKIKNIEHPVSFIAEKNMNNNMLELKTSLIFDRTAYDVNFKSASLADVIKDQAIKDEISLDVVLQFNQA